MPGWAGQPPAGRVSFQQDGWQSGRGKKQGLPRPRNVGVPVWVNKPRERIRVGAGDESSVTAILRYKKSPENSGEPLLLPEGR